MSASFQDDEARHGMNAALAQRVETLERESRRLRRLMVALMVGTAVLLGIAAAIMWLSRRYGVPGTVSDIVAARQFVLRDGNGAVRGLWGAEEDGTIRLILQDPQARPRLRMNLLSDGASGVSLVDTAGRPRAVFALLADNSGSLAFADGSGTTKAVLGVSPDGSATLVFADRNGATRSGIGVDRTGAGTFILADRQGREIGSEPVPADEGTVEDTATTGPGRPQSGNR